MDGLHNAAVPQDPSVVAGMTLDERYKHYINTGAENVDRAPRAKQGSPQPHASCDIIGNNSNLLFQDPDCTLSIGSFTAFCFVALNDQSKPGRGQTAVLRGSHHLMERVFQQQVATGGIVGIEGLGWEDRIYTDVPNGLGLGRLPRAVIEEFTDESKYGRLERTPDGKLWPRPTQILMEEGDACITVYHIAHTATRNQYGLEPRKVRLLLGYCRLHRH